MAGTARRIAGSDDETGPAIFKALATGESRLDLSLASGPRSEVRGKSPDGPVGSWSGPDGRSHPMARHNLYTEPEWLPANAVSSLLSLQNLLITEIRAETRGDSSLIHLTTYQQFSGDSSDRPATLRQNLSRTEILLDADTLRPIILIFNTHPDDDALVDIPIEIHFSDYRTVSGTQVPFHVQKFFNGSLLLDLQFETASINSGLSAGEFAVSTQQ
jgi:hypothetical protein